MRLVHDQLKIPKHSESSLNYDHSVPSAPLVYHGNTPQTLFP